MTDNVINATSSTQAPLGNVPVLHKSSAPPAPAPKVAQFKAADLERLTPEARAQLAESLRKAGHDPAAVEQALSGGKPAPEIVDRRDNPSALSERETAALSAGLDGVSDPSAVDLNGVFVQRPGLDAAGALQINGELRAALAGMQLPALMHRGLAEAMLKASDAWQAIGSDAERALYAANQKATVERVTHRPFAEVLKEAAKITAKLDPVGVKTLISKGVFERAEVIIQLHAHAMRQQARGR
jgi:hypothetical protein